MTPVDPRKAPRWTLVALVAILGIGAFLRVAYLRDLRRDPMFVHPVLDAELHDYWARALVTGDWRTPANRHDPEIPTTPFFRPPGYPYALSAIYRLTGGRPGATRLVQFGMGLTTCLLAFALGYRLRGAIAALSAAALAAAYWPMIFFEGELLDASLLATALLGALLLTLRAAVRPTTTRTAAAGAMLGLAVLLRPNVLSVVPVAAVWLFWTVRRRRLASASRAAAFLLLGCALGVLPCTLRNYRVSGEWVPVTANGGINLWIGNNPEADGIRAAVPQIQALTGQRGWTCFDYPRLVAGLSRQMGRPLGYAEASAIWASQGWSWIRSNPGAFAKLTAKRAALMAGPREVGDRDVDLARAASPVLRRVPVAFPFVLALALVGIGWIVWDGRNPAAEERLISVRRLEEGALLAAAGGVYAASFLPFFFNARYRVPVAAVLIVLAGTAVARCVESIRERSWLRLARTGVPVLAIAGLASIGIVDVPRSLDEWHYQRGTAYRDGGRPLEAIREFEDALRIQPRSALVRNDLALILRDQRRHAEALAQWEEALRDDPTWFEARFNRAQVLAADGRFAEAIPDYEQVLAEQPSHANAHLSLGTALLSTGRDVPGLAHYREAERLSPDDPLVAFVIGRALLAHGLPEEGRAELLRALRLDPRFEPARRALAAMDPTGGGAAAPR